MIRLTPVDTDHSTDPVSRTNLLHCSKRRSRRPSHSCRKRRCTVTTTTYKVPLDGSLWVAQAPPARAASTSEHRGGCRVECDALPGVCTEVGCPLWREGPGVLFLSVISCQYMCIAWMVYDTLHYA